MKKKLLVLLLALCMMVGSLNVYAAATQGDLNHDVDTDDYCLQVYDVNVNLSDIKELTDEEMQKMLLDAASILIQVRSSWTKIENYTVDFSQVQRAANTDGWPVTVTAPKIALDADSVIVFHVYVTDDTKTATVHFANTTLEDRIVDITTGPATLTWADIEKATKDGFTFTAWCADETLETPFLDEQTQTATVTEDITLYPAWKEIPVTPTPQPEPAPQPEPTIGQSAQITPTPVSGTHKPRPVVPVPVVTEEEQEEEAEEEPPVQPEVQQQPVQQQIIEPQTVEETEGEIPMVEMVMLTTAIAAIGWLGLSILSDVRILMWYARKKI